MAGKKKRGSSSGKIIIVVAVLVLTSAAAYMLLLGQSPEKQAASNAAAYFEGVQKRDFDVVFKYNGNSQRRKALILQRATGDKDAEIKELYKEMKSSFEEVAPTSDLRAQWVEKFLFIPGSFYRIIKVDMVPDTENPSQPGSERINAVLSVTVDYPDRDTAPDLNGKVKSAEYKVTMIHSRNISRILREEVRDKKWLFQSIEAKSDTLKYW
ncbi:MAG: hypothetical protein HY891_06625 [Deltaproteobacteria bacterium]|nr:hypothetical protein [Deltaproteobacteria bacterium]